MSAGPHSPIFARLPIPNGGDVGDPPPPPPPPGNLLGTSTAPPQCLYVFMDRDFLFVQLFLCRFSFSFSLVLYAACRCCRSPSTGQ